MCGKCQSRNYAREKDLEKDNGHSLVLVLRKSGPLSVRTVHKGSGTLWLNRCCWNSQKAGVQVKSQKQRTWKIVDALAADQETTETIFRIFVSVNQLSLYGAIAQMFFDRTINCPQ